MSEKDIEFTIPDVVFKTRVKDESVEGDRRKAERANMKWESIE